ncbi:putative glutamine amidotransferase [Holospora obtusa F1]|uniref:Glutamine amidotransferase n=1 Tax=Holospora obtusa F1 TaxID=1399147 RepID=W6TSZ9_HOLOB|nr:gamma-glutamyl-gamma-aminobutyrate hydrolase family protein [Holospora obtusa]ETZ06897.1 putative glutamine amidotransferase [Holospora obtusa F1]
MISVPLILVIPDLEKNGNQEKYFIGKNYLSAISKHGGAPIVVPYTMENVEFYMQLAHGIMITGGSFTIDPELFNQSMNCDLPIKHERTQVEWAYCQEALERKMPILGICGGMQLMNIVFGGTLIQDLSKIPGVFNHNVSDDNAHSVQIVSNTYLAQHLKCTTLEVNSSHRQGVDRLGNNIRISALSSDGIIEGIEHTYHPFCLGVQWHPEYDQQDQEIFSAFIQACRIFQLQEK